MPGFDGTGPMGIGPMTGGGRGYCNPSNIRAGWRPFGARVGYGYRNRTFGQRFTTPEQEIDFLKSEAQNLRRTLENLDARLKEIAGEGK